MDKLKSTENIWGKIGEGEGAREGNNILHQEEKKILCKIYTPDMN